MRRSSADIFIAPRGLVSQGVVCHRVKAMLDWTCYFVGSNFYIRCFIRAQSNDCKRVKGGLAIISSFSRAFCSFSALRSGLEGTPECPGKQTLSWLFHCCRPGTEGYAADVYEIGGKSVCSRHFSSGGLRKVDRRRPELPCRAICLSVESAVFLGRSV